jgi:hypothetical protein
VWSRWEDEDDKTDFKEIGWDVMEWIQLARDTL